MIKDNIPDPSKTWKEVDELDGKYLVSTCGKIYSKFTHKELKTVMKHGKYESICITWKRKATGFMVHILVARAFIPNPYNKKTVNHKNGIKHDNRVENLEWMSYSENQLHSYDLGLSGSLENHGMAKLSNIDVQMIRVLLENDFACSQIAKRFNIHNTVIQDIKNGKLWKRLEAI